MVKEQHIARVKGKDLAIKSKVFRVGVKLGLSY
jgi:hypothetical protein